MKSVFCLFVIILSTAITSSISVHKSLFSSTFQLSLIASSFATKSV